MPSDTPVRTGTQSLERATQLLRVLSERDRFGWGLLDLAARVGLSRSTTHRLLAGLVRERLAQQRPDRRYALGPLVFELGLAMGGHDDFQAACRAPIGRLAARFGTLAILYLRSGNDSVCAALAGPSPYASGLEVGTRLPLVTTAGGIAILVALPPPERRAAAAAGLAQIAARGGPKASRLERLIERSERLGYAVNPGEITRGVNSFGVPFSQPGGAVVGALVVTGQADDFPPSRAAEVVAALRSEVKAVEGEAWRLERRASPA